MESRESFLFRLAPAFLVGMSALLMQVVLMRTFMTAFSGNELDIGITLAVWLTVVGAGSWFGGRLAGHVSFGLSFVMVALLSPFTVFAAGHVRPLLSVGFGETVSLSFIFFSTLLCMLPICFIFGMQFPLAVSFAGGRAAVVYAVEAAGAFLAGLLFTFVFAGKISGPYIAATAGMVNMLAGVMIMGRKSLLPVIVVPIVILFGLNRAEQFDQWEGGEVVARQEGRHGELLVLRTGTQDNLYVSGRFSFAYPDPQTEESRMHMAMTLHPNPQHVLIAAGSPGSLREILKYPVQSVTFVGQDPALMEMASGLLRGEDRRLLSDDRLRIFIGDPRRHLREKPGPGYDLIMLPAAEPSTVNMNRLFTVEFFRQARAALRDGGVLFLEMPAAFGYMGRSMQMANGSIFRSLREVFRHTAVSSIEYGVIAASDAAIETDPVLLDERFRLRSIASRYFDASLISDAFSPFAVEQAHRRIAGIEKANTDSRPVTFLYNLMVWAETRGEGMLSTVLRNGWIAPVVLGILCFGVLLYLRRQRQAVFFPVFTAGLFSMAFSVMIILSYQSAFGYVYERIGLLTGVFMAGMAVGSACARNAERPLFWLRTCDIAIITVLVLFPAMPAAETSYLSASALGGLLTGAEFGLVSRIEKESGRPAVAGRLYGLDLAGSFIGALLTTIFLVPLFGIHATGICVAFVKTVSLAVLFLL